ncbi:SDR family oxidoreductase [Zoogloea sp.]|uniref:SDR family NAD(P)-dependent oxidoreductase n=1 Tax=Zoogloea sp. TaxID=49181 RepID=UPI0026249BB7|nr:SDR family oxidoreductase [Zoogloea sp.]
MTELNSLERSTMQMQTERTVVVTGAAGGMGYATSRHLAAQGWQVLGIDRAENLKPLSKEIPGLHALVADLADSGLPDRVAGALTSLPPVAGLVNMAGISVGDTIDRLSDEDWDLSFAVNVTPAMRLIRLLAPRMKANGKGSIVNVGSPVGIVGARKPSYAASKAALTGLTVSCARNLGPDNIRVNLLLPGPTLTGMTHDWSAERRAAIADGSFLKRLCAPDEIARMLSFLLGEDCSYLTGSVIDMTAGSMWGH